MSETTSATEPRPKHREPLLELSDITKRFGGVTALDHVSLDIDAGEVVGLVGDNGAGKSTLVKTISGAYRPDSGRLLFGGAVREFATPGAAKDAGIETVYQDLALVDTLDAAGNIFLGRELIRFGAGPIRFLDHRAMREQAFALLERLGLKLPDPSAEVGTLSGGQRQSVAISRALYTDPKLVILDEPTSALAVKEAERVLELTQTLREQGVAVILISHTIRDVMATTDRIIVLHRGRKMADLVTADTDEEEVVRYIVGQDRVGQNRGGRAGQRTNSETQNGAEA
ncbi:MAG: ATP-binding cassette domain-containing protein [Trueperaceae bacterium]|nr:ATP-binding cassette domain-containing protein [Trueperaceae bacterium]